MIGATIKVVDPNGVVVGVKAQDLSAGDTEVVFAFEKAYTSFAAIPAGEWVINGFKYDFSAQLAVKAVKEANNQVELLAALQSDYFKNVDADLITQYDAADFSNAVTVADVQEIIDEVNAANISASKVEAVNEATNQIQLLAALQDGGWARVNADWIADYYNCTALAYTGTGTYDFQNAADADKVQAIIDAVNEDKIDDGSGNGVLVDAEAELKTASITDAENLINTYVKPDTTTPLVITKAAFLERVAIHKAVIAVNEATTNNTLKSRLVALATVVDDATTFDIDTVNEVLLPEYRAAIADPTKVTLGDVAKTSAGLTATDKLAAGTPVGGPITGGIQAIVNAVNVEQLALAIAQIETNFTAAKYDADNTNKDNIANALKDLNRLADVSADVDKDDIDASLVGGANGYIATITADILADTGSVWTTGTDAAKAAAIQALIEDVNGAVVTSALGAVATAAAGTDADALLTALKNADLAIADVVDANKAAYLADKAIINAGATTGADDKAKLANLKKAVKVVNAVVDANKATTADAMRAALTNHSANLATPNTDFLNLTAQAKLEVAAIVLEERTVSFADSSEVTTALGATAAAGALKAHADILTAVNGENADSDITDIDVALQEVGYKAYNDLDLVDRLAVAEAFKNNLPRKDDGTAITLTYKTLADIIADIDAVL